MSYPRKANRRERNRWYYQVERCGKSVTEVCTIFGISRQCYYRWRLRDLGPKRSYRSVKNQPNLKLTPEVREFIVKSKYKTNYGPAKMKIHIKRELDVDLSTTLIYRFYKRRKLIRKPQRSQPWYEPLKYHLTITKPGEGVQFDVKYVYEQGKRAYQFSVLDPYTEKHYFRVWPTKHSSNAVHTLKEAEKYFDFPILSVQTDNGSEFRGNFHIWLNRKEVPHYFIPKRSPFWNGKVERVHRTIDDEYYHNPYRVWKTPTDWLFYYNHERIHLSLDGLTPHEFYLQKCNT